MFAQRQEQKYHWPDYLTVEGDKLACVYMDRNELEKEAQDNKELRNILYNTIFAKERWFYDGNLYEDYVLPALFWNVVTHNGMAVVHLMGPSNGGKSYLAAASAHELLRYWEEFAGIKGRVFYFFSYAVALDHMSEFRKGDVVIIDEHSRQLGQDSGSAAARFNNMLRATRKRGVSYFVCDPEEQNLPNCNYMLRTAFYVEEIQMTRSLTYTGKTHRLLGLTDFIVPLDEQWFKDMIDEYERQKDFYLTGFARRGGAADKGLHDKQIRISMDLWKKVKESGMPKGRRGWQKRLSTYLVDMEYDSETNATKDQVMDRILAHLEKIYNEDTKEFDFSIEFDPENVYSFDEFTPFPDRPEPEPYAGQTEDVRGAVLDRMIELGANREIVEAFRLVRDAIDVNKFNLSELFEQWQEVFPDSIIQEDAFRITKYYGMKNYSGAVHNGYGLAFEDVYSTMLNERGIDHVKAGGNTPEPDIVILDENGEPKEVHSVKCFLNKQGYENYDYDSIAESEKELGVPIKLIVLSLACGTIFEIPVDDDFIKNGVRIEAKNGKSIRLPKGRPRTRKEREDNEE
jgi:hypothetical protein